MRHANLAVFVPHAGCPRRCSFCSQKSISGAREAPTGESVSALCAESARSLAGADTDAEIAFFGGSFTAIDRAYMLELLEAAAPLVGGAFRESGSPPGPTRSTGRFWTSCGGTG